MISYAKHIFFIMFLVLFMDCAYCELTEGKLIYVNNILFYLNNMLYLRV